MRQMFCLNLVALGLALAGTRCPPWAWGAYLVAACILGGALSYADMRAAERQREELEEQQAMPGWARTGTARPCGARRGGAPQGKEI